MSNLFETTGNPIHSSIITSNCDHVPMELLTAVKQKLVVRQALFASEYDLACLAANIGGVNIDANTGKIRKPETFSQYVNACVREYVSNVQAFEDYQAGRIN